MPAMPMAESSAPMVVGARQTNSATRLVIVVGLAMSASVAPKPLNVNNDIVTSRNTMVSATSRICRAISLGVRLRDAAWTVEIIWSKKLLPRSCVTRITSQSESTVVPPVTPEQSRARLADHRRRFARDGRLVNRRRAHDDLAVGGDLVAGAHEHHVFAAQFAGRYLRAFALVERRGVGLVAAARRQANR